MRDTRTRKFRHSCVDHSPDNGCHDNIFGGGGGGGGTVTQTNTTTPWEPQIPYLGDMWGRSRTLVDRGAYGDRPGESFIADQSPWSRIAMEHQARMAQDPNSILGRAEREISETLEGNRLPGNQQSGLMGQGRQQLAETIVGNYMNAESNPAVQAAVNAARRATNSQFSGDNFGSSANQEWLMRGATEAAAPILQQERQNQLAAAQSPLLLQESGQQFNRMMQERQNQLNALELAPEMQAARGNLLGAAGAAQEQRGQAEIEAQIRARQAPWQNLFNYQQVVTGRPTGGGSSSGQIPYFGGNPWANALGMGIGGLTFYNMMGSPGFGGGGGGGSGDEPFFGGGGGFG